MALHQVCRQVRRMLLTWTETRDLIFYDDKEFGMKEAFRSLQAQDVPGALGRSLEALARAKAEPRGRPRSLARTHYNLGMCHFILGDCEAARPLLQAALALEPGHGIFQESLGECLRAQQLREAMAQVDSRTRRLDPPPAAPKPGPGVRF